MVLKTLVIRQPSGPEETGKARVVTGWLTTQSDPSAPGPERGDPSGTQQTPSLKGRAKHPGAWGS